jgi:signal transduction histidine kinase
MNFRERGTISTLIVVAALLLLLPLLAVLQYRWLAQLSEREREHMKSNLRATATRFSQDFDDEITRAYTVFSPSPDLGKEEELSAYAARYDRWLAVAQYPRLVKDVLVAHADEKGQFHLHQLKTEIKQFVPCDWPQELAPLRSQLEPSSRGGQRAFGRDLMNRRLQLINDETVVCLHPILIPPTVDQRGQIALPAPVGFVIVTLSMAEIQQAALPALAKRHFFGADGVDGFEYSAAIVTEAPEPKVIYRFGPESSAKTEADVTVGLMGLRREEMRRLMISFQPGGGSTAPAPPPAGTSRPPVGAQPPPNFQRGGGPRGFPPPEEQKLWQLHLTHHAGSLEAAVASLRRRNLLISFGILLLLTASIALVILSARRAHRLARQQMDFVAGVSHELRTPLAVIKSAAWNLTRGVIKDPEQIKRYSTLIGRESDRLIEMIEQVLEFAGAQSGRQKFDLQPASVNELIDNVLASAQPLLSEGNFQVEKNIAADLPLVMVDAPALARALRNLIDNAMKYSGDNRWIGVQAQTTGAGGKSEVRITVSDHGLGIPAEELKHIFEPFWRGSEATTAQIHGNGLGLNLVKNIVTAHGGDISVQSAPGKGSSFTLTLPAISHAATQPATVTSYLDAAHQIPDRADR